MARVLIGTDGSDLARLAAERARDVLDVGAVTVATVVQPVLAGELSTVTPGGYVATGLADPETTKRLHDQATALASDLLELFPSATVRVTDGEPGPELCRLAAEEDIDVIVVGSHGAGFLRRVLLGSVSTHVLRHAPCPVLVVRSDDTAP